MCAPMKKVMVLAAFVAGVLVGKWWFTPDDDPDRITPMVGMKYDH